MKDLNIIHKVLGVVPVIWLLLITSYVIRASLILGHIPVYGIDPDPFSLKFNIHGMICFIFFVLGYFSFWLWLIVGLIIFVLRNGKPKFNIVCTICFILGVAGFFILKYGWNSLFAWIMD